MKIHSEARKVYFIAYLLFTAIFLAAGIFGHDPWKQDETYSFGIIYHFYITHSWLVPENAGIPFMEKPPIYYWTAVISEKLLSPFITLPDAARIASIFYMIIAAHFIWKSARMIFRNSPQSDKMGLVSLALFLGTLGVVRHAHDLFTDVALLAGTSIAFYGMALCVCDESWKKTGLWLGTGIGIAFLSKGFFTPAIFATSFLVLFSLMPRLRTLNTLKILLTALLAASPFLFIWPMLLYQHSHALFMQWFWDNNVGRFLGFSVGQLGADNKPYYILYSALWFAFPVFPLAVVALWRDKLKWKNPEYLLPAVLSLTGIILLLLSSSARALYILPLIPALTILAAQGLPVIPGMVLKYWNTIIRCLSIIAVVAIWLIWWSLQKSHPLPQILPFIAPYLPVDFTPDMQWIEIATAVVASASLLFLPDNEDLQTDTARIWFTGIATLWIVVNTLLLPWLNYTKSYRPILGELQTYINHSPYKDGCINDYHLGESIAPMLEYFSENHTLHTIQVPSDGDCRLVFTVTSRHAPLHLERGWKLLWKGSRALDAKDEELRLYARHQ